MASLHDLIRIQIDDAEETTFGTAEASFSGIAVPTINRPGMKLERAVLQVGATRDADAMGEVNIAPIRGLRSGSTLSIEQRLQMVGSANAAGDGVQAVDPLTIAQYQMLYNALGGAVRSTGTTVDDVAASTTEIDLADASGFAAGGIIGFVTSAGLEVSTIASIATDTVTLARALSAAPANSSVVYGALELYGAFRDASIQFNCWDHRDRRYDLYGCRMVPKLSNLSVGQVPTIAFDGMVTDWTDNSEALSSYQATYPSQTPQVPGYNSTLLIGTAGATTRTVVEAATVEVDLGLEIVKRMSVSGVQGVGALVQTKLEPKITITVPSDSTWNIGSDPQSAKQIQYQIGSGAGSTVAITADRCYLESTPETVAQDSVLSSKLVFACKSGPASLSASAHSPIRISLL